MKEVPISKCEQNFLTLAIKKNLRVDSRKNDEFRDTNIQFGSDWGSCLVTLGETKVLANVSCELGIPKATRPTEGLLFINVELGPMAAPHFELGRNTELSVQINRMLERAFKDSRCVDLESLCVTAEERVWLVRVDINVLNHDGNLIDCCSIATLAALAHFRRPDVSIIANEAHIHTFAEKEPIPMVLHHYPVCISYCIFEEGLIAIADPTAMEERVAESLMVFGLNSFRELCCLNLGGTSLTSATMLLQCAQRAANRAKFLVDYIKQALEADQAAREASSTGTTGFSECLQLNTMNGLVEDRIAVKVRDFSLQKLFTVKDDQMEATTSNETKAQNIVMGDKWLPENDDDETNDNNVEDFDPYNDTDSMDNEEDLAQCVETALQHTSNFLNQPISKQKRQRSPLPFSQKNMPTMNDSGSEEESTVLL